MLNLRFLSAALSVTAATAAYYSMEKTGAICLLDKYGFSLCAITAVNIAIPVAKLFKNWYSKANGKPSSQFNRFDIIGGVGLVSNVSLAVTERRFLPIVNLIMSGIPTGVAALSVVAFDICDKCTSGKSLLWNYHSDGQHKKIDIESIDDEPNIRKDRLSYYLPI